MRIVVTGASGQLGSYLIGRLVEGPHEIVGWSGRATEERAGLPLLPVDLTDLHAAARALENADPDVVIHAAAVSSTDAAHRDPARSEAVNVRATQFLSEWTAQHDRRLVFTSTDLVFDGSKGWYREDDPANPILVYGHTKHVAERSVLAAPRGLVVRLSLLYGPSRSGRQAYFDCTTAALRAGISQTFLADEYRTPLDYDTASEILVRLAESDRSGLMHAGGPERLSRFELMCRAASALGIDPLLVKPNSRADIPFAEPRPPDLSLDSSRLHQLMPDIRCPRVEDALASIR